MSGESPSEPGTVRPRGTAAVSLHERFSRILLEQQTHSGLVTFDPILLQQNTMAGPQPVVLLMKKAPLSMIRQWAPVGSQRVQQHHHHLRRRSVWTRLGWQRVTRHLLTSRPRGFWSFMNKYRWKASVTSTWRRRRQYRPTLKKGGATALKGRGCGRKEIPTKKQLDAELDQYMSLSRRRLDEQLEDYMAMSRSRLDAELDEYMLMAGQ